MIGPLASSKQDSRFPNPVNPEITSPIQRSSGVTYHPDMATQRTGPLVWLLVATIVGLHMLFARRYGYFRDELYYIACSEHLDWGYVDQPPLTAALTWLARHLFGSGLIGLRLLPAMASGATVWLTAKTAREMGGRRFAQGIAALALVLAPICLILWHWMTMNAFEPLLWTTCAWLALRATSTRNGKYWLWFGVVAGVGLENKYSMAFFAAALMAGLLLTRERRWMTSRWLWFGGAVALLIFLPNLVWLYRHDFPFLELMHNVRMSGRDIVRGPPPFIVDQAVILGPVSALLWVSGAIWLLLNRDSRFRVLGWTYVIVLVTIMLLKGKNYYATPAYPMLFAAGGVALEHATTERFRWFRALYPTLLIAGFVAIAPFSLPLISPERFIAYQERIGWKPPASENQRNGPLPQYFADEFGWDEMAREVALVYNSLSSAERARTAIFANNYGEAAAIDFFGPKYGLPKAISNHQTYWYWGSRDFDGSTVIVLGSNSGRDRDFFERVDIAGWVRHPYSRLDEHFPILVCRGLKTDFHTLWPQIKRWN